MTMVKARLILSRLNMVRVELLRLRERLARRVKVFLDSIRPSFFSFFQRDIYVRLILQSFITNLLKTRY